MISSELPVGINYKAGVSAQLKSAVILAGLNSYGITKIVEEKRSRDHTENILVKNSQSIKIKMEKKKTIQNGLTIARKRSENCTCFGWAHCFGLFGNVPIHMGFDTLVLHMGVQCTQKPCETGRSTTTLRRNIDRIVRISNRSNRTP